MTETIFNNVRVFLSIIALNASLQSCFKMAMNLKKKREPGHIKGSTLLTDMGKIPCIEKNILEILNQ